MDFKNKRKYKRIEQNIKVTIASTATQHELHGKVKDISEGGMCLLLSRQPLPGSLVRVKFEIEKPKYEFTASARIVWCSSSQTSGGLFKSGIQFVNLDDYQKKFVHLYPLQQEEAQAKQKEPPSK